MRFMVGLVCTACVLAGSSVFAQGQDSQPYERDLQVVATMIAGGFDNANQSYFDSRGTRDVKHRRLHIDVDKVETDLYGEHAFIATAYWDSDEAISAGEHLWVLDTDAASGSVRMRIWGPDKGSGEDATFGDAPLRVPPLCEVQWRREAAQFRGTGRSCGSGLPREMLLSEKQLWIAFDDEAPGNDYQLHRVRDFECYADIPGVGGGRDIPYERYDGFKIHDQGGAVWFESKEGRKLGISLFLVDWPINNYEGIFTRDSFVIYVSEEIDGERKEHGYAFTVPDADRIGINLKWLLASCFMKSNRFETPYM